MWMKTWYLNSIEFHWEDKLYKNYIDSYERKTRLIETVQTDISQLNSISIAMGYGFSIYKGNCIL